MFKNNALPPHVHSTIPFWYAAGAFIFIPLALISLYFYVQRIIHFRERGFISRRYAYGFFAFAFFLVAFAGYATVLGINFFTDNDVPGVKVALLISLALLLGSELMMRISAMRALPPT